MRINLNGHRIGLERGRTLQFKARAGTRVKALRGDLWITQDGDRNDYMIASGQQLVLRGAAPIVIQAESDSELALYEGPATGWWAHATDWLTLTVLGRRSAF